MSKTDWNARTLSKIDGAILNGQHKEDRLRHILIEQYKHREYTGMINTLLDLITINKMRERMFKMRDSIHKHTILNDDWKKYASLTDDL